MRFIINVLTYLLTYLFMIMMMMMMIQFDVWSLSLNKVCSSYSSKIFMKAYGC